MGPDVFNKETGISWVYHIDCYVEFCPAVWLLHYVKGSMGLMDYTPDCFPKLALSNFMWVDPPYAG